MDKQIHELTNTATDFASDDYIAVDNATDQTRKMSKDVLMAKTAQNALASVDSLTAKTSFASGDKIAVVNGSTATAMGKDDLLKETAKNALAGNVAPAFVPNSTTTVAGYPYIYNGSLYIAKEAYQGAWDASKFYAISVSYVIRQNIEYLDGLKLDAATGKNIFDKNTKYKLADFYVGYEDGKVHSSAGYNSFIVPVKAGQDIAVSANSINVSFYSAYPDLSIAKNNDYLKGYISGYSPTALAPSTTTPSNCVCLVVSVYGASNTLQIEYGTTRTAYESYIRGVDKDKVIGIGTIEENINDLDEKKLNGEVGKNLLDRNSPKKGTGFYVNYSSGKPATNASYSSYIVPVDASSDIVINKKDCHISFYSDFPDLSNPTIGVALPGYISGFVSAENSKTTTTPAGCVCLVVSFPNSYSNVQIEYGTAPTAYEAYVFGLNANKIIGLNEKTFYVGSGMQYTSINDAINAVPDYSTIVILPGIYNESVDLLTTGKFLHLLGLSKDKCIIRYSNAARATPPMNAAKGLVENLTIETIDEEQDPGAPAKAYAIHIDFDAEANSSLTFKNCYIRSDDLPAVGIGLRENFTLSFIGCFLEASAGGIALYLHEQQASNKKGQRIEVVDCTLFSKKETAGNVVSIQETINYTGNEGYILFQRNIVKNKGSFNASYKGIIAIDYDNVNHTSVTASGGAGYLETEMWTLEMCSEMNTLDLMNFSGQS